MNDDENQRRNEGKPDDDAPSAPEDFVRMREWIRRAQTASRAEQAKRGSREKEESAG
jgi:hypothetical protein